MDKKIIEKYIQFAIENGFKGIKYPQEVKSIGNELFDRLGLKYNLIEVITSKEFIEAVARGLKKEGINNINIGTIGNIWNLETKITYEQAEAIRDLKLEEFVNNLLK